MASRPLLSLHRPTANSRSPDSTRSYTMLKDRRLQGFIVLAAGALLGYLAASGKFLSGPEAIASPVLGAQENSQSGEPITITVRLPADAVLDIDDYRTKESGTVRTFRTPPLPAGKEYSYTIKA